MVYDITSEAFRELLEEAEELKKAGLSNEEIQGYFTMFEINYFKDIKVSKKERTQDDL